MDIDQRGVSSASEVSPVLGFAPSVVTATAESMFFDPKNQSATNGEPDAVMYADYIAGAQAVYGQLMSKFVEGPSMQLSENAMTVMVKRYLLKDHSGKPLETPTGMCRRVANKLASNAFSHVTFDVVNSIPPADYGARVFERFKVYYTSIWDLAVIPGGRTLANDEHSVPNCVVLNIQDSLRDIMQTLMDAALLQQAGCGIGFPLHLMRPTGAVTKTSGGTSSGPVSFLRVYNMAFGTIKQQNRHGANMAIMSVTHPDILEFIHCKSVEGSVKNFNISVGLTEEFMSQVSSGCTEPWIPTFNGEPWKLRRIHRSPGTENVERFEEVNMTASDLFREIVEAAWRNGAFISFHFACSD